MDDDRQAVLDRISEREVVELAKDLVNIPSPTGEEAELAEFIVEWLSDAGINAQTQTIEDSRYNAVGRIPSKDDGDAASLSFNGHMDTSQTGEDYDYRIYGEQSQRRAWRPEAFERDGRLYGAGMMNDKGPIAAFLVAAKAIEEADVALDEDIVLAAVAGEIGKAPVDEYQDRTFRGHGVGTRHLLTHGYVSDYAIVAENSGWGINWALPGALYLKVTVHGRPSYISNIEYDSLSEDHAIHRALNLADSLREWGERYTSENTYEYENGWIEPKVNVGAIRAGLPPKPNYAPGLAQLYVDVRVPPNRTPEDVRKEVTREIRSVDETAETETYRSQKGYAPAYEEVGPLVEQVTDAYETVTDEAPPEPSTKQTSKWNDVNIYHEHGIPAVKIAPGPGPLDTQESRRSVTPDELTRAAELYATCALSICKSE